MAPHLSVSVVVPARNEQHFLPRALRSLQRQTVRDLEILVVDDGSTDATTAVVARAAAADPRIRLLRNEGTGFVDALNTGVQRAAAPLVARLDADDLARPRRLAVQLAEFGANPAALAVGTYGWRANEAGVPVARLRVGPVGPEGYRAARAAGTLVNLTHSSVTFRRDAFERAGGYQRDYHPADDFKLWNSLAAIGEVYAVPQLLTVYTLRRRCISVDQAEDMLRQLQRIAREHRGAGGEVLTAVRPAAQRERIAAERARRVVSRALVNGHAIEAFRAARAAGLGADAARRIVRKALRG